MTDKYAVQYSHMDQRVHIVPWHESGVASNIYRDGTGYGKAEPVTFDQAKHEVVLDLAFCMEDTQDALDRVTSLTKDIFDAEIREYHERIESEIPADMPQLFKHTAAFLWQNCLWGAGWRPLYGGHVVVDDGTIVASVITDESGAVTANVSPSNDPSVTDHYKEFDNGNLLDGIRWVQKMRARYEGRDGVESWLDDDGVRYVAITVASVGLAAGVADRAYTELIDQIKARETMPARSREQIEAEVSMATVSRSEKTVDGIRYVYKQIPRQ